jgi:ADP-heptose:LPS heptosyltransferase
VVGIHPGASWPAKHWLPDRFAALASAVVSRLNATVVLTGGPRDADTLDLVQGQITADVRSVRSPSLRHLAALASQCTVFVSNDAGPMHIAAAVGTPTIGIFGPGEENIWFPYAAAEGHLAMRKDVPCHPCHLDFCNREGDGYMECMKLLSMEEVFERVQERLTRGGRAPS